MKWEGSNEDSEEKGGWGMQAEKAGRKGPEALQPGGSDAEGRERSQGI